MSENPDVVLEHKANTCSHCGKDISTNTAIGHKVCQVVDVQIVREVTEHRSQIKKCHLCGKITTAAFPRGVTHYVQYGDIFSAIVICLSKGNYIPYGRLSEIARDIFGIGVSC